MSRQPDIKSFKYSKLDLSFPYQHWLSIENPYLRSHILAKTFHTHMEYPVLGVD